MLTRQSGSDGSIRNCLIEHYLFIIKYQLVIVDFHKFVSKTLHTGDIRFLQHVSWDLGVRLPGTSGRAGAQRQTPPHDKCNCILEATSQKPGLHVYITSWFSNSCV